MIDGKDVTTDWLECVFDDAEVIRDYHRVVGFIKHCLVSCSYNDNRIIWEVIDKHDISAYMILEERLRFLEGLEEDHPNVYSVIQHGEVNKWQIIQNFYFKED